LNITVYSLPSCMKCKIFMKKLDTAGIQYTKIDDEPPVMEASEESGLMALPIVKIDDEWYSEQSAKTVLGV